MKCPKCANELKELYKPFSWSEPFGRFLACPFHGIQYGLEIVGGDIDVPIPIKGTDDSTFSGVVGVIKEVAELASAGAKLFDSPIAQYIGRLETKPAYRVRVKAYMWVPTEK